jgi:hypothetical protein
MGFEPMLANQCLFKHKNKGILILLYVNDFRIATFSKSDENWLIGELLKQFDFKLFGPNANFLGF